MLQGKRSANKKKGLYFEAMPVKWRVPSPFENYVRYLSSMLMVYKCIYSFLLARRSSKQNML